MQNLAIYLFSLTYQVAERIITMKKMKQAAMRLFSTLVTWLGMARVNMGPDVVGKLLKNFCESVNKARDTVVKMKQADREASTATAELSLPRSLTTQQKARGTRVPFESTPEAQALSLGVLSELSEKVSKVTAINSEEASVTKSSPSLAPEMPAQGLKATTTKTTKAQAEGILGSHMEGNKSKRIGGDKDIQMEASVEELDLLLADFTIKSRERRRRRLR